MHTSFLPVIAAVATVAMVGATAGRTAAAERSDLQSYGWPVKPFDHAHPVRGGFGDPRTLFHGSPNQRTLMGGDGSFQFHFGVDISAPDGTAVYPVEPGLVTTVQGDWVQVDSPGGRAFQYWHVASDVSVGQRVDADATVLGHITRGSGHVHLSELNDRVYVNPLQPGHLSPYSDTSDPSVTSIQFLAGSGSPPPMPTLLRGRVQMIAAAHDLPSLPVPGDWHGLPVTPAVVKWRIDSARTHHVVVPERIVYDVRQTLPPRSSFWSIYARGTYQNMSVFGKHFSYLQPGSYLFRLAPGGFDTRTLDDDVYELVVTAIDIRGNEGTLAQRFAVHNAPGVAGV